MHGNPIKILLRHELTHDRILKLAITRKGADRCVGPLMENNRTRWCVQWKAEVTEHRNNIAGTILTASDQFLEVMQSIPPFLKIKY